MAVASLTRTLISKTSLASLFSRSFSSSSSSASLAFSRSSPLLRVRPIVALAEFRRFPAIVRCYSTRPTTSSLNDSSPNWSNRPPKETILLDGCDFEHWLVVMEPPEGNPTRDEIIDSYIKTLAQVIGSEDDARMKIYSVSTRHYFAFGALVSEELSYKIKELPRVRWVLPDSYLDVKNKDYGGEPFINGQAVPYDPKYHEEWVRNNARANERSRRNDRPRNFDRSRNFERRRENMQNRDFQNRDMPPMPNRGVQNVSNPMPGQSMPPTPSQNMQNPMPGRDMPPNPNMPNPMPGRDMPHNPNMQNSMPGREMPPMPNPNQGQYREPGPGGEYMNRDSRGFPNRDFQNAPPNSYGGMQNNYQKGDMPNRGYQNSYAPNREMGVQNNYQNSYAPNRDMPPPAGNNTHPGSDAYQGNTTYPGNNTYQGRDVPGRDY